MQGVSSDLSFTTLVPWYKPQVSLPERHRVTHLFREPCRAIGVCYVFNNEPVHEISNNVVCATSKASDQPAHTRSLIRPFASCLSILCD